MSTYTLSGNIIVEDGQPVATVDSTNSDTGLRLVGMLNLLGKLEDQLAKIRDLTDIHAL